MLGANYEKGSILTGGLLRPIVNGSRPLVGSHGGLDLYPS